jgi:hypothetical protein
MNHSNKNTPGFYALRRTLPPWKFETCLAELLDCVHKYALDEVIVMVDTEEFSHGHPTTAWFREYQKSLFRIKEGLEARGVLYSVNVWASIGHNDRGRDSSQSIPGLKTMVGHDGIRAKANACPLSQGWRDYISEVYGIFAETKPHVLWVDDDIRTFNHQPVKFGCFCEDHLEHFSRRIGIDTPDRASLVATILQEGDPHPWRSEFLSMQAEIMVDVAGMIANAVHAVSPETHLGLMSSGPRNHCAEGRDWAAFSKALGNGRPFYSRPPMGLYREGNLRELYYSQDYVKQTRHVLPSDTFEMTEVENFPYSRYAKSVNATFLQMAVSAAYGSHGITLDLHDHSGTPMENEPWYGRMLASSKPFLTSLSQTARKPGMLRGVRLLHHRDNGKARHLGNQASYAELIEDGTEIMHFLESHGLPTTYEASEKVCAVSGQALRAFSDDEIRELLSGALYLDAVAAFSLCQRGFGDAIGLSKVSTPLEIDKFGVFGSEECHHPEFGGEDQFYLNYNFADLGARPRASHLQPLATATVISHFVDPDCRRILPGMIAFENAGGGRVIIHAYDYSSLGSVAYSPLRLRQLHSVFQWLSGNRIPVLVNGDGVFPLALRHDAEDGGMLLGLFNLSLDEWHEVTFDLDGSFQDMNVESLGRDGRWEKAETASFFGEKGRTKLRWSGDLPFTNPLFLRISSHRVPITSVPSEK